MARLAQALGAGRSHPKERSAATPARSEILLHYTSHFTPQTSHLTYLYPSNISVVEKSVNDDLGRFLPIEARLSDGSPAVDVDLPWLEVGPGEEDELSVDDLPLQGEQVDWSGQQVVPGTGNENIFRARVKTYQFSVNSRQPSPS